MDEGGYRNWESLSEEAQCGGPLGRAPLLGAPDTAISVHMGPFTPKGNLESGGGEGFVYRGLCE